MKNSISFQTIALDKNASNLGRFKQHELDKVASKKIKGGTGKYELAWEIAAAHGGCPPPEQD